MGGGALGAWSQGPIQLIPSLDLRTRYGRECRSGRETGAEEGEKSGRRVGDGGGDDREVSFPRREERLRRAGRGTSFSHGWERDEGGEWEGAGRHFFPAGGGRDAEEGGEGKRGGAFFVSVLVAVPWFSSY